MKFWTKAFRYRLGGNGGLTFIAPFMGSQIVLSPEITDSILLSLISTVIVTSAVIFRRMERVGNAKSE
jgi:hypothetical protein